MVPTGLLFFVSLGIIIAVAAVVHGAQVFDADDYVKKS